MRAVASSVALIAGIGLLVSWNSAGNAPAARAEDHVTTLYSVDDILHSWSFSQGEAGTVCIDGRIFNRNSQLMYDKYGGQLVSGVEGRAKARILDIGDLRVNGTLSSVFHSLAREGHVVIAEAVSGKGRAAASGSQTEHRFDLAPGTGMAKTTAEIGHVYLIRIDEDGSDENPIFAVLRVLDHAPKRYVTFRWRLL